VKTFCYVLFSEESQMVRVYKIVDAAVWAEAVKKGVFSGAEIDLADGFIHLSDASQVEETAKRHFADQHTLLLVTFDAGCFGESLRWEKSRGGALFPHLYGPLDPAFALWAKPLPWDVNAHRFPEGWQA
jgi:uncharacterized protein (DUF952 family)